MPARAIDGALHGDQGRRGGRRLVAGPADGGDQPPLHRRHPRRGAASNLLAALIDNHLHHGNSLGIDPRQVLWKRALDMNDWSLRNIVVGLGGKAHGVAREDGFQITVASEVMAILCLAEGIEDLERRLGRS